MCMRTFEGITQVQAHWALFSWVCEGSSEENWAGREQTESGIGHFLWKWLAGAYHLELVDNFFSFT